MFIDATHIKASANKQKKRKVLAEKTAQIYDDKLREEINIDCLKHGKNPLKEKDDNDGIKETVKSTIHVSCDKNSFILSFETTVGNIHRQHNV